MDLPTYADLFRVGRDKILSLNSRLTREVIEREGSDSNALVAAAAAIGDEVIGQLARIEVSLCLGAATGKDLTRLVYDRYGLLRKPAGPARGTVEFFTTVPTGGSFAIPTNTTLQTSDGIQFVTTLDVLFPALSTGPISVPVRSTQGGLVNQAGQNTIKNIVSTIFGAPDDLAVNNALATAGAVDEESDDQLRQRAVEFFITARKGTLGAIKRGALDFPGVTNAEVFEVVDTSGHPAREVQLIVTDSFTETLADLSTVPPTYQTQAQTMAADVFDSLIDTRAGGIFVNVLVAKVILQPIVLALGFRAGFDADAVALKARGAVVAAVNGLPPGTILTHGYITRALQSVPGLVVSGNEVLSPAGDVLPTPLEVLRTTMGIVSLGGL